MNNDILTRSANTAQSDTNSPQYQAMDWLVNVDGLQLIPSTIATSTISNDEIRMIINRYVLAVFAYGFGGENSLLHTKLGWLSGNSTCSWRSDGGQLCDGDDVVNMNFGM